MAGDEGKGAFGVGALPHVHIRATHASSLDADEHLILCRPGVWKIFQSQVVNTTQYRGFHRSTPPRDLAQSPILYTLKTSGRVKGQHPAFQTDARFFIRLFGVHTKRADLTRVHNISTRMYQINDEWANYAQRLEKDFEMKKRGATEDGFKNG